MVRSKREITSKQCDKTDLQGKKKKSDRIPAPAPPVSITGKNHSPSLDLFSHLHSEDNKSICHVTWQGGYQVIRVKELWRL